jgi:hypothetical protein
LRLARIGRVHAVESEEKALAALDHAARNTQGLKPVTIERRDLFRRPLMAQELKAYDAVVFDPPRAGAEFQSKELARSAVKKIVAVSCNPLTLARDHRPAGRKRLSHHEGDADRPILWTSHVEVVAALEKCKKKNKGHKTKNYKRKKKEKIYKQERHAKKKKKTRNKNKARPYTKIKNKEKKRKNKKKKKKKKAIRNIVKK